VDYDHLFKILLIGDSRTGKSSLLLRFVDDTWTDSFISTIGVDFRIKTINVLGRDVKLQIWDTAGQQRFRTNEGTGHSRARVPHAVITVYDITDLESYSNVKQWLNEIDRYTGESCVRIIAGNKCDDESNRKVPQDQWRELDGIDFFTETSAKQNINVDLLFISTIKSIFDRIPETQFLGKLPVYVPNADDFERMVDRTLALYIISCMRNSFPPVEKRPSDRCCIQ